MGLDRLRRGPAAYVRQLQIDRILPAAKRTPERERVILNVDLQNMWEGVDFELLDGGGVTVLGIGDRRDNQVMVEGHVEKPGVFELVPHMTLGDVISRAGGLLPDAFDVVARRIRSRRPVGPGRTALGPRLEAALNGRSADLFFLPGDVLEVP